VITQGKVTTEHLQRLAYLYVRQSSLHQVHEHRESTARQYELKRRAQALGWSAEQLIIVDEDQGLSGASAAERSGFQRMVAEVGLGHVGVVMGLEVSRLARNSADWHRLLEICALSNTLILDEDGIYDPSHFNDRLLLGLKGTMSEAELHLLRARLLGGQLNKARRGELWIRPPIGYVFDPRTCGLVLDPDEQIQDAVRLLFETFRRTGSALRVVRYFGVKGIGWPRRIVSGARAGEIICSPLEHDRVLRILHNPRYTGAFVYGRTRSAKIPLGSSHRYRRLPRQEWKVFLPNSFPGYISWEQYEANQEILRSNARGYGYDRRRSPAREGTALLQGLILCGKCGDRMTVRYHVRRGQLLPSYLCQRRGIQSAKLPCQVIPGSGLDEVVSGLVLEAVSPASLEVALEVFEELRARRAEIHRLHRIQVQRAREEVELAQRQFMLVRPENRLVADSLERRWNEKLAELSKAEEEYARAVKAEDPDLSPAARERIHALVSDLPRVWNDACTPARERKRILRLLIEDVTLIRDREIRLHVRWKGGATTSLELPLPLGAPDLCRTSATVVELVRSLASEQTDRQIAQTLNARSLCTGAGRRFSGVAVWRIRQAYAIRSLAQHKREAGWHTTAEISAQFHIPPSTLKRYAHEGILNAQRVNDKGQILFAPFTEPPPQPHHGKRLRDRRRYPKLTPHVRREVQYEA
jgi:DNA invertase Pin-like site-specific DNA recombinase